MKKMETADEFSLGHIRVRSPLLEILKFLLIPLLSNMLKFGRYSTPTEATDCFGASISVGFGIQPKPQCAFEILQESQFSHFT